MTDTDGIPSWGLTLIRCYEGLLGSGKTHEMVRDAMRHLKENHCMIYTNMAGLKFPEAVYFDGLGDIMDLRSGLVMADEMAVAAASRSWADMDKEVLARFAQLRKHGLDLWYTSQDQDHTDKNLRDITNEFVLCRRFLGRVRRLVQLAGQTESERDRGWNLAKYDPAIMAIYDTLEVIERSGGSAGRAEMERPLSRVARKRAARDAGKEVARLPTVPLTVRAFSESHISPDARAALEWLKRRDLFDRTRPVREQAEFEVQRRAWLNMFGLTVDDVPHTCSHASPWLDGHDPATVKRRSFERELLAAQAQVERLERTGDKARARKAQEDLHFLTTKRNGNAHAA